MLWTNEYLARISLDAEIEIARETESIIDRLSLSTISGTSQYQLPEYVQNIRKILWKGFRLDPAAQIDYENWIWNLGGSSIIGGAFEPSAFSSGFEIGSSSDSNSNSRPVGRPFQYFYSTFGENVVIFNPGINETIASVPDNLWGSEIGNSVIIEFYRVPDGTSFKIPHYIRRRTIKSYVMWKSFEKEGPGQNLQAAEYYRNRYQIQLLKAKRIVNGVYSAAVIHRESSGCNSFCEDDYGYQGPYKKPRPVLPSNYGIPAGDFCDYE